MKKKFDNSAGPSTRQERVSELVRRAISDILTRGDHFEPALEGVLISVIDADVSPDLRVAKITILPHAGDQKEILAALNNIRGRIRQSLNKEVKLKYSPELRFSLDKSMDYASETHALIDALNKNE